MGHWTSFIHPFVLVSMYLISQLYIAAMSSIHRVVNCISYCVLFVEFQPGPEVMGGGEDYWPDVERTQ